MNIKKIVTAVLAGVVLTLGTASVAVAAPGYTPAPVGGTTGALAPGATGTFSYDGFTPGEAVTFTLTGENGAGATLAASNLRAAVTSSTKVNNANGSGVASVAVTLPTNATGTYTLSASGAQSGVAGSTITITATIAATGADVPAWLIWGAVGAVGLGVIALIAVSAARRTKVSQH